MPLPRPLVNVASALALAVALASCDLATDPQPTLEPDRSLLIVVPDTVGVGDTIVVGAFAIEFDTHDTVSILSNAYTSSDTAVVGVTPLGLLVAREEGDVVVTGQWPLPYSGIAPDTERVVVRRLARALVTTIRRDSLTLGDTATARAELRDGLGASMGASVTWRSSDTSIARVDLTTGLVRVVGDGDVRITASAGGLTAERTVRAWLPRLETNGVRLASVRVSDRSAIGCGLDASGSAYCWSIFGEASKVLGRPPLASGYAEVFAPVSTSSRYTSLAMGRSIACGTMAGGTVECWGDGARWQAVEERWRPSRVPVPDSAGAIISVHPSDNQGHCVLAASGTDYCWGGNTYHVIGADTQIVPLPRPIPFAPGPFATMDPGDTHGCALDAAHSLFCWGDLWQAGLAGDSRHAEVVRIAGVPAASQVAVTWVGTCVLATDGTTWCGGRTPEYQAAVPLSPVAGAPRFTRIDAFFSIVCGLTAEGELWCWDVGQGPLAPIVARRTPTLVSRRHHFVDFSVGRYEIVGVTAEGAVHYVRGNYALGG